MRVTVTCACGWRRELSGFYAGKRIRCADCQGILEVPGDSEAGAYLYPPLRNWEAGRHVRPEGRWVPIAKLRPGANPGSPCARYGDNRGRACYRPSAWQAILFPLALLGFVVLLFALGKINSGATDETRNDEPRVEHERPRIAPPTPKEAEPDKQADPVPEDESSPEQEDEF